MSRMLRYSSPAILVELTADVRLDLELARVGSQPRQRQGDDLLSPTGSWEEALADVRTSRQGPWCRSVAACALRPRATVRPAYKFGKGAERPTTRTHSKWYPVSRGTDCSRLEKIEAMENQCAGCVGRLQSLAMHVTAAWFAGYLSIRRH